VDRLPGRWRRERAVGIPAMIYSSAGQTSARENPQAGLLSGEAN